MRMSGVVWCSGKVSQPRSVLPAAGDALEVGPSSSLPGGSSRGRPSCGVSSTAPGKEGLLCLYCWGCPGHLVPKPPSPCW